METKPHLYHGDRHLPHDWDIHKLMYEVPGFGEPDIKRYIQSREKNKDELKRITLKSRFKAAEASDRQALVQDALTSSDIELQRRGAELVQYVEADDRAGLQELVDQNAIHALSSKNAEERQIGATMAKYVSETASAQILELTRSAIDEYLEEESKSIQKIGAQMIGTLQDYGEKTKYQGMLSHHIQTQISSGDVEAQVHAAELMRYLPQNELPDLISSLLCGKKTEAQTIAAQYIKRLRPQAAIPLLRQIFKSDNLELKKTAVEAVTKLFRIHKKQPDVPPDIAAAISTVTSDSIASDNPEVQQVGAEMLKDVPDSTKLTELIKLGMESEDSRVRMISTKAIQYLSTGTESKKDEMLELVLLALQSGDYAMQKAAVAVARHVPEPGKTECMEQAFEFVFNLLHSDDRKKQKQGAEMAYNIDHPRMGELFETIENNQELLETLMFSRLYPDEDISDKESTKHHKKVPFLKTGSEMTVLRGGPLERKLIVRHIKKNALIGWMKAFEDNETWLEHDFDYVPVEPIQSFSFSKNRADVCAGVLDIDLKHWINISGGRFVDELRSKREKIISVLQELGIRHSDLHEGNFFLKFPRRENGKIDTQRCPRIYIGDFDKSILKK